MKLTESEFSQRVDQIADYLQEVGEGKDSPYKRDAYINAAIALRSLDKRKLYIESYLEGNFENIFGIGPSINRAIWKAIDQPSDADDIEIRDLLMGVPLFFDNKLIVEILITDGKFEKGYKATDNEKEGIQEEINKIIKTNKLKEWEDYFRFTKMSTRHDKDVKNIIIRLLSLKGIKAFDKLLKR